MFENRYKEVKQIAQGSSVTESIMMDPHGNWRLQRHMEIREKNF